jgi:AraC family ethanolamine operon transcriptional activator
MCIRGITLLKLRIMYATNNHNNAKVIHNKLTNAYFERVLSKMNYFECDSVDVYIDNLQELNLEATQVSKGAFFSKKNNLKLPLLEINHWQVNVGMLYNVSLSQDKILLSFPIKRDLQKIDGITLGSDSILAVLPDEKLLLLHPEEVKTLDFLIPFSVLQEHYKYQETTHVLQSIIKLRNKTEFSSSQKCLIDQLTKFTIRFISQVNRWSYQATIDAQDSILQKIFEILDDDGEQVQKNCSHNRTNIVKRAITNIHNNPTSNITILELSTYCFCSIRTLEYSFKSILGYSPKEYLIKRRLNLIRKEIQRSPETSISRIAMDFGVVNAGRLSKDYYMFFGEFPSDTRNK